MFLTKGSILDCYIIVILEIVIVDNAIAARTDNIRLFFFLFELLDFASLYFSLCMEPIAFLWFNYKSKEILFIFSASLIFEDLTSFVSADTL